MIRKLSKRRPNITNALTQREHAKAVEDERVFAALDRAAMDLRDPVHHEIEVQEAVEVSEETE